MEKYEQLVAQGGDLPESIFGWSRISTISDHVFTYMHYPTSQVAKWAENGYKMTRSRHWEKEKREAIKSGWVFKGWITSAGNGIYVKYEQTEFNKDVEPDVQAER